MASIGQQSQGMRGQPHKDFDQDKTSVQTNADGKGQAEILRCMAMTMVTMVVMIMMVMIVVMVSAMVVVSVMGQ